MAAYLDKVVAIACLILGFGFVILFHELGHFLAAKWVGIKVEQFAVGFGQAIVAWRKGLGVRLGTTRHEFERRVREHLNLPDTSVELTEPQVRRAAEDLKISETEYRINWLPLGGYVKMLGQDDMNPNAQSEDPRAYNRKSIRARMVVVSAGVIMNVILAAILFMVLFLVGFKAPPPVVGEVLANSPAQKAGIQVGDRIVEFNGHRQYDFRMLPTWVALSNPGQSSTVILERNGQRISREVQPQPNRDMGGLLTIGVGPTADLRGPKPSRENRVPPGVDPATQILPGDIITAVNGASVEQAVAAGQDPYVLLDRAVQTSGGKPVQLTVRNAKGQIRTVSAEIFFTGFFDEAPFNIAGLRPLAELSGTIEKSPLKDKVRKGDIITAVSINGEPIAYPTNDELVRLFGKAAQDGTKVGLTIQRDGKRITIEPVVPDVPLENTNRRGLGVGLDLSTEQPIVADTMKDSAASRARIPKGALIQKINGKAVATWFDVRAQLQAAGARATVEYAVLDDAGKPRDAKPQAATIELSEPEQQTLASIRYGQRLALQERIVERKTGNPIIAAEWGAFETRDLLIQAYVTIQRLFQGSMPAKNVMGPLGIVATGSHVAQRGTDWLIWFLAMISANLAVVNFLPIPIVDGGLFVFLILEKIMGRPLSPRMQTVAQLVGLAIILSVFVFATYHDIYRMF